ncbi:MAG TPA: hypothetical protein VGQ83_35275 [Polyangia bacterium]
METFEVTRKLFSWGPAYEVRKAGATELHMTVKGKLLTATPKLTMVQGQDGPAIASLSGNFTRTRFEIKDGGEKSVGTLSFPMFALKKGFTLTTGGAEYKASGGFLGAAFGCSDAQGQPAFDVKWEPGWADKFVVSAQQPLPPEVLILATVAVHQKYYEHKATDYAE